MTLTHDTDTVPSGATRSAEGGPLSRRSFMGLVGAGTTALGVTGMGARMAFATPASPSSGDVIVVVFMRGAWDGLSVVAPYQMPTYKALRPTIRIKESAEFTDPTGKAGLPLLDGGAVAPFPLSGTFAFNPSMTHLHQGAWADGHLAVVHAAGMPASESSTRSHFEAEQYWEKGTRSLNVTSGFLNRYLSGLSGLDRLSAVGRGSTLQTSLQGAANAVSMGSISGFGVTGFPNNTQARTALVGLYPHGPQLLEETGLVRSEQRDDKRPQLSDLRESGSIEQDADMVWFVFREDYYVAAKEPKRPEEGDDAKTHEAHAAWAAEMERVYGTAELIVAKQRHGSTGKVRMRFESRITRFSDLADESMRHESYE